MSKCLHTLLIKNSTSVLYWRDLMLSQLLYVISNMALVALGEIESWGVWKCGYNPQVGFLYWQEESVLKCMFSNFPIVRSTPRATLIFVILLQASHEAICIRLRQSLLWSSLKSSPGSVSHHLLISFSAGERHKKLWLDFYWVLLRILERQWRMLTMMLSCGKSGNEPKLVWTFMFLIWRYL